MANQYRKGHLIINNLIKEQKNFLLFQEIDRQSLLLVSYFNQRELNFINLNNKNMLVFYYMK